MGLWYDLLIQYWCYFYSFAASVLFPFKLFDATTDELIGKYDNLLIGQKYDWDCGLACCAMAIRWSGRGDDCSAELYSNQELTQRPLWTIDLLIYLLNQNVAAEMYTIYTGVNPDHDNNIWYNQHGLAAEAESINQKFQLAKAQNLRIHEEVVSLETLVSWIKSEDRAAIVLVDNNRLAGRNSESYSGHYIFLVDYVANEFVFLDPGQSSGTRFIKVEQLQNARVHTGTDQDVILCYKNSV